MKPQRACESLEETRQRLRKQINVLRQKRNVYAAYHDVERADSLLAPIATLEAQLTKLHKQDTEREGNNARTA